MKEAPKQLIENYGLFEWLASILKTTPHISRLHLYPIVQIFASSTLRCFRNHHSALLGALLASYGSSSSLLSLYKPLTSIAIDILIPISPSSFFFHFADPKTPVPDDIPNYFLPLLTHLHHLGHKPSPLLELLDLPIITSTFSSLSASLSAALSKDTVRTMAELAVRVVLMTLTTQIPALAAPIAQETQECVVTQILWCVRVLAENSMV